VSKAFTDLEKDNAAFRVRSQHQADQRAARKGFETIEKFFDPVQNLKRAIDAGDTDPGSLLTGVQMVLSQFVHKMEELGVTEAPGVGAPFDPNIHEALAITPVTDVEQDGKVLVVYATGYLVGGKVLQAAQVVIGKYEAEPAEA
jgi:molecular chaperone GrpE